LRNQACDDVSRSASREADNDAHRVYRIRLRPCDARHQRQRDNASGQMQKFAAGKLHSSPSAASNPMGRVQAG
jgi:hypothetical protein